MARLVLVLLTLAVCMAPLWAAGAPRVMATVLEVGKGGLPTQIKAPALKTLPLLTGPMTLSLLEDGKPMPLPALAAAEPNLFELPSPVSGLSLSLRHGREAYPFMDLTVGNTGASAPTRRVTIVLTLSVRPQADQVFFPATARAHDSLTPGEKPRQYGYAGGGIATALPVGQVYSGNQDWGLAFFGELGLLVEPWQVTLDRGPVTAPTAPITVTIALPLSVPAGQSVRRRVYFAATEGDWRPALGAVLAQFPHAFVPRHPDAVSLDGPFVCKRSRLAAFTPRPGMPTTCETALRVLRAGEGVVTVTARRGETVLAKAERPVQVVATSIAPEGLKHVQDAMLELEVFGSDAGNYAAKTVSVNGVAIGNLPAGYGDSWHSATLRLSEAAVKALGARNEITIDNQVGDAFKVRNLRLLLTMRGGMQAVSRTDTGVYRGWTDWAYGEGKQFAAGQPLTGMRADVKTDPTRQETYEWFFGTPQSGKVVLEAFGADGGQYAHKPVSVNGIVIADLPSAPSEWTEIALPLTPAALAGLRTRNTLQIENSRPPDAFKVRRLRVEIVNTAGRTWTTETDEGAYTSCGWDYAEGKVGSPIAVPLAFREEVE